MCRKPCFVFPGVDLIELVRQLITRSRPSAAPVIILRETIVAFDVADDRVPREALARVDWGVFAGSQVFEDLRNVERSVLHIRENRFKKVTSAYL